MGCRATEEQAAPWTEAASCWWVLGAHLGGPVHFTCMGLPAFLSPQLTKPRTLHAPSSYPPPLLPSSPTQCLCLLLTPSACHCNNHNPQAPQGLAEATATNNPGGELTTATTTTTANPLSSLATTLQVQAQAAAAAAAANGGGQAGQGTALLSLGNGPNGPLVLALASPHTAALTNLASNLASSVGEASSLHLHHHHNLMLGPEGLAGLRSFQAAATLAAAAAQAQQHHHHPHHHHHHHAAGQGQGAAAGAIQVSQQGGVGVAAGALGLSLGLGGLGALVQEEPIELALGRPSDRHDSDGVSACSRETDEAAQGRRTRRAAMQAAGGLAGLMMQGRNGGGAGSPEGAEGRGSGAAGGEGEDEAEDEEEEGDEEDEDEDVPDEEGGEPSLSKSGLVCMAGGEAMACMDLGYLCRVNMVCMFHAACFVPAGHEHGRGRVPARAPSHPGKHSTIRPLPYLDLCPAFFAIPHLLSSQAWLTWRTTRER